VKYDVQNGFFSFFHIIAFNSKAELNLLIKQQILNIKKHTSLHYCVRATKSNGQNSKTAEIILLGHRVKE